MHTSSELLSSLSLIVNYNNFGWSKFGYDALADFLQNEARQAVSACKRVDNQSKLFGTMRLLKTIRDRFLNVNVMFYHCHCRVLSLSLTFALNNLG